MARNERTQALAGRDRAFRASLRQHEGELVAAAAGNGVGLPQAVAEQRGHLDEHTAAAQVTMFVVDLLETVEVDDEHGQRPSGERRTRRLPAKRIS